VVEVGEIEADLAGAADAHFNQPAAPREAIEGAQAAADYQAASIAALGRLVQLRAGRLARQAADPRNPEEARKIKIPCARRRSE